MGLDAVELVMTYESAFRVDISDEEAARMRTPQDVVDFLLPRLGESHDSRFACLSARAFYQFRNYMVTRQPHSRNTVSPRTLIVELFGPDASEQWADMQRRLDCENWPKLKRQNRLLGWFGGVETLGEAAAEIAMLNPRRFHPEPWNRSELEAVLMRITETELGLEPGRFTVHSRFVEDMRID
ncbi:MAG TPA: hypothetical protein VGR37_01150 [Longimicrobiaceae bacterium]|nr:hypothetical protein [Longimicrobiaceae bacterium]